MNRRVVLGVGVCQGQTKTKDTVARAAPAHGEMGNSKVHCENIVRYSRTLQDALLLAFSHKCSLSRERWGCWCLQRRDRAFVRRVMGGEGLRVQRQVLGASANRGDDLEVVDSSSAPTFPQVLSTKS